MPAVVRPWAAGGQLALIVVLAACGASGATTSSTSTMAVPTSAETPSQVPSFPVAAFTAISEEPVSDAMVAKRQAGLLTEMSAFQPAEYIGGYGLGV